MSTAQEPLADARDTPQPAVRRDAAVRRWADPDLQLERAAGQNWWVWRGGTASQQLRRLAEHLDEDDRRVLVAVECDTEVDRLLALVDIDVYEATAPSG